MAKERHIQHVRSKVVENNGQPKLPSSDKLLYGELAINYHKGTETVSLKNDADEIVTFHDEVEIGSGQPKVNTEIFIDTGDQTVVNIYTEEQIDAFLDGISETDRIQDDKIQQLIDKTDNMSSDTIPDILDAIDNLNVGLSNEVGRAKNAESGLSNSISNEITRAKEAEAEISGLAENAYEIQIGTGETYDDNIKVVIDTDADAEVLIYTKEQIDSQISGITSDISDLQQEVGELSSVTENTLSRNEYTAYTASTDVELKKKFDEVEFNNENGVMTFKANGRNKGTVNFGNNYYNKQEVDDKVNNLIIISENEPTSGDTDLFVDTTNDGDEFEVYTKAQVDSIVAELQRQIDELKNQ